MADESVDLTLNAEDNASKAIGDVADAIDNLPDDATVEVEADTRDALSNIERFDRDIEDLTRDGQELRIEFRAQSLQAEIKRTLREIERLEDPVEIEARTADLERAQKDMRDLADLADRKYEVEIDADPKRTAQRAGSDLDTMRQRGEGMQSAIPAIRGFGDELGGTAQAAGVASQAVADLGDFALIAGERFTAQGSRMSGIATKLGTILGSAGLAGAFAGIGVQLGQVALPAIQRFISGQGELTEETKDATAALKEQLGLIDGVAEAIEGASDLDPFVTAVLGQFGDGDDAADKLEKVTDAIVELGGTVDQDLAPTLKQLSTERGVRDFLTGLEDGSDLSAEAFDKLTTIVAHGGKSTGDVLRSVDATVDNFNGDLRTFVNANGDAITAVGELRSAATGVDLGAAYSEALDDIRKTTEGVDRLAEASENLGAGASDEQLLAEYERLTAQVDAAATAAENATPAYQQVADQIAIAAQNAQRFGTDGVENMGKVEDAADDVTAAVDEISAGYDRLRQNLSDEQAVVDMAAAFDDVETAAVTAWTSTQEGADNAAEHVGAHEQKLRDLKGEVIDYSEQVANIPPEEVTNILALIDQGKLDQAESELADLARTRYATIYGDVTIRRNVRYDQGSGTFVPAYGRAAAPAAGPDTVAARGVAPLTSPLLASTPSTTIAVRTDPATINNVTVNLPTGADARDVVRAVDRWARINGRTS